MNSLQFAAILMMVSSPAPATDVSASIITGQPGFYGQIDIGDYPPPQLIYRRPVRVERDNVERAPIYLRVPPGHVKDWRKHCREYNACAERVYFVENDWYQREYVPRYQERHGKRHDGFREVRQVESKYRDDHQRGEHGDKRRSYNRNDHGHAHMQ